MKKNIFISFLLFTCSVMYGQDTQEEEIIFDEQIPVSTTKPAEKGGMTVSESIITGKVSDVYGKPIAGAIITVKGTSKSVTTNLDGKYSILQVPKEGLLVFSFMGMAIKEVPLQERYNIDVVLRNASLEKGIGSEKNPGLSCALSILLPGLGQFYNGEAGKGLLHVALVTGGGVMISMDDENLSPTGLGIYLGTLVWSAIDAARSSNRINAESDLSFNIGTDKRLSINPNMLYIANTPNNKIPAYGISLKFDF